MAGREVEGLVHKLDKAFDEITAALHAIGEAELKKPPKEGEWSAAQVAGHVIEMSVLWAAKARAAGEQGTGIPGRTPAEQEARRAAVERYSRQTLAAISRDLRQAQRSSAAELRRLNDGVLDTSRARANGTETTIRAFVEDTLVRHVLEHAVQVKAARV